MGALHVVSPDKETAGRVKSQLSVLQRSEISNPPSHGARIVRSLDVLHITCTDYVQVALILNDAGLFAEWKQDIATMAGRIIDMRRELFRLLSEKQTPGNWEHIVNQIGMFRWAELQVPTFDSY